MGQVKQQEYGWKHTFEKQWRDEILAIKNADRYRIHRLLTSAQSSSIKLDGKTVLNFSSNDYLGLANHESLKESAIKAIEKYGVGSGASHMVIGHHELHEQLAERIARFTQRDKALIFSSGYMANIAAISGLAGKNDVVFLDKLNHASLIDGARLVEGKFRRYLHNDLESLEAQYFRSISKQGNVNSIVVTDGVFSMDGNLANLNGISEFCQRNSALMMVDDAHGLGVIGDKGEGSLNRCRLNQDQVPVLVGTFGKAFGTSGAFIAGPALLIDYLTQVARPYIFTTAMPPSIAAATTTSIDIVASANKERQHLKDLIALFRASVSEMGYELRDSDTPIQPIIVGESSTAIDLSSYLLERGILVSAIRPPTVPKGTSRLRVTLSASHSFEDVERLIFELKNALSIFGEKLIRQVKK